MNLKHKINKIEFDEFGRYSGIIAVNKSQAESSHDLVDKARKVFQTKKVGHAGALDIFATGLVLLLVGKATKLADNLINLDKSYNAKIILGLSTSTQDPEGEIKEIKNVNSLSAKKIATALKMFLGKQDQFVSIYSSVKVEGQKLRKVLRDKNFIWQEKFVKDQKFVNFYKSTDTLYKEVVKKIEIPKREINIYSIDFVDLKKTKSIDILNAFPLLKNFSSTNFYSLEVNIHCSKGTYIRQLAEDIGKQLNSPACLINLERTAISAIKLTDAISFKELEKLVKT